MMDAKISMYYNESVYGCESGLKVKGEDHDSVHIISSKGVQSSDQQLSPVGLAAPSFSLPFFALSPKNPQKLAREDSIETCRDTMDGYMSEDVDQFTSLNLFDQEMLLSAYNQIYPETSYGDENNSAATIKSSILSTAQFVSSSNLPQFVSDNFDESTLFQIEKQTLATQPFPVPSSQAILKKREEKSYPNPVVAAKPTTNARKRGKSGGEQHEIIAAVDDKPSGGAPTKRKRQSKDGSNSNSKSKHASFDVEEDYDDDVNADRSRNAINAKLNREKKKAYTAELEAEVKRLTAENGKLAEDASRAREEREACVREIQYLTNVLVTQSALSKLLTGFNSVGGVGGVVHGGRSSLFVADGDGTQAAAFTGLDHDYHHLSLGQGAGVMASVGRGGLTSSGGICLHVDTNRVSLEMCVRCGQQAAQ